ncbi:MAG: PSD1 and planctomycete cytochrome C domain-containing protein [Bacteroidota bacterium]
MQIFAHRFVGGALLLLLLVIISCSPPSKNTEEALSTRIPDKIDFNFHVRPILSDRCYTCHGPDENKREAGLRLDTEAGAFTALGEQQDRYAIVRGEPSKSLIIERIHTTDSELLMPPPESNLTLKAHEVEILTKWIEQGAEWKRHWAFIPPEKQALPETKQADWVQNDIDHFVLARLEQEGFKPSAMAPNERLLRRLSFDLTGLPPTAEDLDAYLSDASPQAYENAVDRFLASDAFGERMASLWLDAARYADSHGYQDDLERTMWPYRNWVIHAFNSNMPYDKFATWQLAGDLLPEPSLEQKIATGFNRNHMITQEGGVIEEEYRVEYVADRVQTFGTVFLGLTMQCARCHDHKYDPLSMKEYYGLFSFFNNVPENGKIRAYGATPLPFIKVTKADLEEKVAYMKGLALEQDTLELMVMEEMESPRQAYLLNRGAYDQHGDSVSPTLPAQIMAFGQEFEQNRLGMAKWLFHPENPITARVTVNRYWQMIFGNGIVKTPEDFGNQGALPSHPELLDWLAIEFQTSGWDTKHMLKLMVMSATYRQDSRITPELERLDPENLLLARGPRYRLPAEMIRDQALAASGLLVKKVGGPSVKPYQPAGLWEETTGGGGGSLAAYKQDSAANLYRRSLYTFWKRTIPPPNMITMDATRRGICEVKRQATSTPLQALVLLNDPTYLEAARLLATRMIKEGGEQTEERIAFGFRLLTARTPQKDESQKLQQFLTQQQARLQAEPESVEALLNIGEYQVEKDISSAELAAYTLLASSLLNLDEVVSKS